MNQSRILAGGLLAGLLCLPAGLAQADDPQAPVQEKSFTQSVKDSYREARTDLRNAVDDLTDGDRSDARRFRDQYAEDLKDYRDSIREARDDYMEKRRDAQKAYLEDHGQLPMTEDIQHDLNALPTR